MIHNPDYHPGSFRSWLEFWQDIKKAGLDKEQMVRSCWHDEMRVDCAPFRVAPDSVKVFEAEYDIKYVKLKCFDEIESKEPEQWDHEMIQMAGYSARALREQYRLNKMADWLTKTAEKEYQNLYKK